MAKQERKRERNRVAASKCRQRKLDRIKDLEVEVKRQQDIELHLDVQIKELREQTEMLRVCFCQISKH